MAYCYIVPEASALVSLACVKPYWLWSFSHQLDYRCNHGYCAFFYRVMIFRALVFGSVADMLLAIPHKRV